MPMHLHNTLTRTLEPLTPGDPTRLTFYSCGPTVYDDAHIGNFRSFLAADLLRRWLEHDWCELHTPDGPHAGPRSVVHVMNITDVGHMTDDTNADGGGEDKMALAGQRIAEAKKAGRLPAGVDIDPTDPYAIASYYTERFLEDARRLGLKVALESAEHPGRIPRATDNIDGMRAMIEDLADKGFAYRAKDAVYFDVQSFPGYGALSGNTLERLRAGAGGRVDQTNQQSKKHPADFLLWKADASHIMKWPGPTIAGEPMPDGYPGWHIECSVMARGALGDVIDVHSGGEDNIFPHHECERAQSCCATGNDTFARAWFHPRFLMVEGEKMSKSKGNFFTARDLFARGHEPGAVRLELIKTHYRSNANFTAQGLRDSQRMLDRWRRLVAEAESSRADSKRDGLEQREQARREFAACMHDDINIAGAIAAINSWINRVGECPVREDAKFMRTLDRVLGVLDLEQLEQARTSIGVFMDGLEPDQAVVAKLEERARARASKDFATSDRIRDELADAGYAIKDVAGGKVEVRRN